MSEKNMENTEKAKMADEQTNKQSPYLTIAEAAVVMRATPKAVRRMIEKGLLKSAVRRIGRRVLVSERALVTMIDSGGLSAGGSRR